MPATTSDPHTLVADLAEIVGAPHVLQGKDMAPWQKDWTGQYESRPLAVVRPADTGEVSAVMRYAQANEIPVVPVAGNTGLTGGAFATDMLVLSVERLSKIHSVNPDARVATVGSGVVVDAIDQAAEAHDLTFPLSFGASGSARIGGALSTNAGGSNVLRYGTARELCLGIEAVLANGDVIDLLSPLRKNNTGFDLRNLLIGAEGQLGIITAATVKLYPRPHAHFTAMIVLNDLSVSSSLLNAFQDASDGQVSAFEYMSGSYFDRLAQARPDLSIGFETMPKDALLVEISTPREIAAEPLMQVLETAFEQGWIADALVAQNEAQRQDMWHLRELSAELIFSHPHAVDTDVALPLDRIAPYLDTVRAALKEIDPDCVESTVGHLGDGNLHVAVHPSHGAPDHLAALRAAIEGRAVELGGTFSAEHGIGVTKRPTMAKHKNATQLKIMRAIKASLDPLGILNPGKVLPAADAD